MTSPQSPPTGERADLLESLAEQREFLRFTVRRLTEEEATRPTTTSALNLGGLIKHVADTERAWTHFVAGLPSPIRDVPAAEPLVSDRHDEFNLLAGETLAGMLDEYTSVARETERVFTELDDLDTPLPLPEAPWFPPGAAWSPRRILLHIIRETAQHAGHADILRESLDGATTMTAEALAEYTG
ncbi:DinB family protein [Parasphingorhabdus pacifica]